MSPSGDLLSAMGAGLLVSTTALVMPGWRISKHFRAVWHGQAYSVNLDNSRIMITAGQNNDAGLKIACMGYSETLKPGGSAVFHFDHSRKGDFYVL